MGNRKLITASAPQNLDTKNERTIHRLIPILVAENITRVSEYASGKAIPRVDLWNCVGMRMDKAFNSQTKYTSRRNFSSALLEDKYTLLEELGVSLEGRTVIRDDDDSTKAWLENKVKRLLSSGNIYKDQVSVNICDKCDYLQSIEGSEIDSCTLCNGRDFHQEKKEVLLTDIPRDRSSLLEDRIIHPKNTKQIQTFFDQLPSKMMISKVREYGLPLDSIGLEEYVLDPKISVALMPNLLAEKKNLSEITLVQGAAIATNALPYTSMMTSGFHHTYILLPKIPFTTLEEAQSIGLSFMGRYLPFILMKYNKNITSTQLKTAQKEYSRITWKIDNILSALQSEKGQPIKLRTEDHQMLSEIIRDFSKYNIRKGQKTLGQFFKSQGRRYAEELRHKGYHLNPTEMNTLKDIVRLFYK